MRGDAHESPHQVLARTVTALQIRLEREAADAAALCEKVLTGPRAWWGERLRAAGPPTFGLVQEILRRSRAVLESSPEAAQAMTGVAVELAGELGAGACRRVLVDMARAQALRDHASVLSFRGFFAEALESAEESERIFAIYPVASYETARLALVKAVIFRNTGRIEESLALARGAAETFLRYAERRRYAEARLFEGATLHAAGAPAEALAIWQELEHEAALDERGRLRVAYNAALCLSDLGDHEAAIPYLSRCLMLFEQRRMSDEATRSRAALGKSLVAAGQPAEALIVLRRAGRERGAPGMVFDAGLVALQEAEAREASRCPTPSGRSRPTPREGRSSCACAQSRNCLCRADGGVPGGGG